jgi:hypothetical protein
MSEYNLTPQEAIGVIDKNWPQSNYTMLREALEMAKEALKKQIPEKPKGNGLKACPNCNTILLHGIFETVGNCCKHCGQKLDWGNLK